MTIDERDLTPPGVFTMFTLEPPPADLLSAARGDGLLRNLDRIAERVRDEAIAEFMATPEAQAAHEKLVGEEKARVAVVLGRMEANEIHVPPPDIAPIGQSMRMRPLMVMIDTGGPPSSEPLAGLVEDTMSTTWVGLDFAASSDRERWRPQLVHPRGRWRSKKRAIRALAEDLGYPECLEVAHPEQVDGGVMQAVVRLRDFYKLHRGRTTPAQAKAERAQQRADRREMAATLARGEPPF